MEDVHRPVLTLLVATTAHVELDTLWLQIVMVAMVTIILYETTMIITANYFVQISMSVAPTKVDVVMSVPTMLVALCVHVTLDMSWILMEHHAMVSLNLMLQ